MRRPLIATLFVAVTVAALIAMPDPPGRPPPPAAKTVALRVLGPTPTPVDVELDQLDAGTAAVARAKAERAALERASRARRPASATRPVVTRPPVPATTPPVVTAPPLPASSGYPPMGALLRRIGGCESSGDPDGVLNWVADNPSPRSTASGAFGITDGTWHSWAAAYNQDLQPPATNYRRALDAPPHVQTTIADRALDSGGTSPWNASKSCWG